MAFTLRVGDSFPRAELPDQNDAPFSLQSLKGAHAVVYFYPKDAVGK